MCDIHNLSTGMPCIIYAEHVGLHKLHACLYMVRSSNDIHMVLACD
jgi:hypothetical protein